MGIQFLFKPHSALSAHMKGPIFTLKSKSLFDNHVMHVTGKQQKPRIQNSAYNTKFYRGMIKALQSKNLLLCLQSENPKTGYYEVFEYLSIDLENKRATSLKG